MREVTRLFVGQAVRPSDRPTGRKQEREPQIRDVSAPSLPRGNHLVARMKTSPGFGRSSSPSRVTPVAMSRSQLPVTVAGPRRGGTGLPFPPPANDCLARLAGGGVPPQGPPPAAPPPGARTPLASR